VVIILSMIIGFLGFQAVMKSPAGKDISNAFKSAMHGAREAVTCDRQMQDVHAALERYTAKNGKYPAKIDDLVPDYLPDGNSCHCGIDDNPDPKHVTFDYTPPKPGGKPTDPVLGFTWKQKIQMQGASETVITKYYYTAAGKEMMQQTTIDPSGREIVGPAREKPGDH
jgi:hypothetical protein